MTEQNHRQRGNGRQREEERAGKCECEGERHRPKNAALDTFEREDREHRRDDDGEREEDGTNDLLGGAGHDARHFRGGGSPVGEVPVDVFDEDDGAVEENSEIDGPDRHHVRGYAGEVKAREGGEKSERHCDGDGDRPRKSSQEEPQDERDERRSFRNVVTRGRERRVDQLRPIVKGDDLHPLRKHVPVDSFDRLVHFGQHVARVFTAAQEDGSLDRVHGFAAGDRSAPRRVPLDDARDVANEERRAALRADDGVFDVRHAVQDVAARGRAVRSLDRGDEILQRDRARAKPGRIGQPVVLLLVAAEAHDVGDPRHAHELLLDDPVLPTSDLARRMAVALQRVLVNLADRRVVRAERGDDAVGHLRTGQLLGDLLASEVDVDAVLEGHDHLRQTERGDRPLHEHVGHAEEGPLDGYGDFLLDFFRRLAGKKRDDHHLHVGHVRERLDLEAGHQLNTDQRENDRHDERCGAALNGEIDEAFEHGLHANTDFRRGPAVADEDLWIPALGSYDAWVWLSARNG